MAEKTGIAWTDHTWSPWIGCTEVSPGCDNCYARTLDRRHQWGGATHWGVGKPRHRTMNWRSPVAWNKKAAASGKRWTVFPSLCDPFDNEVPEEWRHDLWKLIRSTPNLTWLLLTKRIGNVAKMHPGGEYQNVWLGASVVNQEEADRDIPKLLATPAPKRFVSYEPALGPVDFRLRYRCPHCRREFSRRDSALDPYMGTIACPSCVMTHRNTAKRIAPDWIIIGGESSQGGAKARPFDIAWARSTISQCKAAGVPAFFKQAGSFVIDRNDAGFDGCEPTSWPEHIESEGRIDFEPFGYVDNAQGSPCRIRLRDRAGADPAEWPEDLRVQEFPA